MDKADKERLLKNYKDLLNDVDVESVLPHLVQEKVFTFQEAADINEQNGRVGKTSKLLMMLPEQGPHAYKAFRKALLENHEWLVRKLDGTDVQSTKQEKREPVKELNHEALYRVSRNAKVMKGWKQLGYVLGIEESDVVEIEYAHRDQPSECVYQTLLKWKCRCGRGATVKELIGALRNLDFDQFADELEGK